MESRAAWRAGIAVGALAVVGAVVLVLGRQVSAAAGRGEHAGLLARNASYEAPAGQPPVQDLKVDRLRDDFNAAAGGPRILLSLSPT